MKLTEIFKGKMVNVMTDAKVVVQLEIETLVENITTREEQITPDTPENDWWGHSITHRKITYVVGFTNGYDKTYDSIESINFV
jgi:hypothetical protein